MSASSRSTPNTQEAPASLPHVFALMRAGMALQARDMALGLLRRDGGSADLFLLLAAIHDQMGILTAGIGYIEQCLALAPQFPAAIVLRARLLHRQGRSSEAIAACDAGLALLPGNVELLLHKAETQDQSLQPAAALETLQPLLSQQTISPVAAGLAARAMHALGRHEEAIDWARRGAEDPTATAEVSRNNWMQVTKVYDRLGRYDEAMAAALKAHTRSPGTFAPSAFMEQVESLIQTFSRSNVGQFARASDKSQLPVFLIGMPRSGTSLVEQIIASHPEAHGAGELSDIAVIARSLTAETGSEYVYPDCIDDVSLEIVSRLGDGYLRRLKELGGSAQRVTNKALDQYEHVGLIWMLLPGARIIHVRRDPLDTCLSCFTRYLSSVVMPYVTSLEHLGMVYLQHERLLDHWKQVLDLPILTVQYEELVADQERITRQIIDFLGLLWDDRCLRYWEAERTVMTLSYDQVNKPVYDSSIGRWRNYEKHLGPLKKVLGLVT